MEPAAAEDKPKVAIVSSDGETFMVPRDVAFMSATLRNMLEDLGEEGSDMPIPLPNVKADALRKVIEFCEYHAANPDETSRFVKGGRVDNFREFDRKYSDELREDKNLWLLFSVILAANYLDVKPLVDVTCRTVASMIKGKTPEQICDIFRLFSRILIPWRFTQSIFCGSRVVSLIFAFDAGDGGMRGADIKKNPTEKELQEVRKANPWLEEL